MKTCIIYASTYGSTELCAKKLGDFLQANPVSIHQVSNILLDDYDCIILGSSIYVGQINKTLKTWISKHEQTLLSKKLGLFLCCGFDDQKSMYFTHNFSTTLLEHATVFESFGGMMDESKMKWIHRMITKMVEKSQKEKREVILFDHRIEEFATGMLNG